MIRSHCNMIFMITLSLSVNACQKSEPVQAEGQSNQYSSDAQNDNCFELLGSSTSDTIPALNIIISKDSQGKIYNCSSIAISHNLLLTAGHCITSSSLDNPETYAIRGRSLNSANYSSEMNRSVRAKKVWRNSLITASTFNPNSSDHRKKDIAVLLFPDQTFSTIMPIASQFPAVNNAVKVAGFGSTSENHAVNIYRNGGMNPQNAVHTLQGAPSNYNPASFVDMFYISGQTGVPMPGDSGGPMIYGDKVVGVASAHSKQGAALYYGLYTRLDRSNALTILNAVKNDGYPIGSLPSSSANNSSSNSSVGAIAGGKAVVIDGIIDALGNSGGGGYYPPDESSGHGSDQYSGDQSGDDGFGDGFGQDQQPTQAPVAQYNDDCNQQQQQNGNNGTQNYQNNNTQGQSNSGFPSQQDSSTFPNQGTTNQGTTNQGSVQTIY